MSFLNACIIGSNLSLILKVFFLFSYNLGVGDIPYLNKEIGGGGYKEALLCTSLLGLFYFNYFKGVMDYKLWIAGSVLKGLFACYSCDYDVYFNSCIELDTTWVA